MITVNDQIRVHFSKPWTLEKYKIFIKSKRLPEYNLKYCWKTDSYTLTCPARFAHIFNLQRESVDREWLPFAPQLFDYQQFIVRVALEAKRYAIWADTGLGKTIMFLEFARQVNHKTNGKVLLIVPLNIIQQTIDEAAKFYGNELAINQIESRDKLKTWCENGVADIGVTNPEKFIPKKGDKETISELQHLTGVVLDEASILKAGGGKIKWALIKSCRGIEYKLSCTATPAPNEVMEYASQGSFLEKLRSEGEILWTYFTRDKENNWKVKDHARDAFYRFMSGWSVYLRSPKRYGFADNLKGLPKPSIKEYKIDITPEQRSMIQGVPDATGQLQLFGAINQKLQMTQRSKFSQIAKGFLYRKDGPPERIKSHKPYFVANLVQTDVTDGLQVLVWTVFDEESTIISEQLLMLGIHHQVLTGKIQKAKRIPIIENFRTGKTNVLISKASLLGFGLNFQNCGSMVFSGFNDSFEQFYQAVRRAYRYGQTKSVRVHIPYIPELEGVVWSNVQRKQQQFETDCAIQERNYLEAMKEFLKNAA